MRSRILPRLGNFGELTPGLIRLGTITSYDFDKSTEGYVDDCNALKLFLGLLQNRRAIGNCLARRYPISSSMFEQCVAPSRSHLGPRWLESGGLACLCALIFCTAMRARWSEDEGIQVVGEGHSEGIRGAFQGHSGPKKGIQEYGIT